MRRKILFIYMLTLLIMLIYPPALYQSIPCRDGCYAILKNEDICITNYWKYTKYGLIVNLGEDTIDGISEYQGKLIDLKIPLTVEINWIKLFNQYLITSLIFGIFFILGGKRTREKLKQTSSKVSQKLNNILNE